MRDQIHGDLSGLAEIKGVPFPSPRSTIDLLGLPGTWAVLGFRLGAVAQRRGWGWLAEVIRSLVCIAFGADLSPRADVAPGLVLPHPSGVVISPTARVGRDARLMGNVRIGLGTYRDPLSRAAAVVGDDCWLFDGAAVQSGCAVGDRSVLGTNAVASADVAADVVVIGDPARVVRRRVAPTQPAAPEEIA